MVSPASIPHSTMKEKGKVYMCVCMYLYLFIKKKNKNKSREYTCMYVRMCRLYYIYINLYLLIRKQKWEKFSCRKPNPRGISMGNCHVVPCWKICGDGEWDWL